jgi:phosphonate transport system ATP-binding protein
MDYLRDINRTMNITCLVNLHQVDVAIKYSERIIGITSGRVAFDGPAELLDADTIHDIYQSATGELITDVKG